MPIERDGFYSMLGIAMRAGALTLGESGVRQAVQSGKACCVLVDEAASERSSAMPARTTTSSCLKPRRIAWARPLASRGA